MLGPATMTTPPKYSWSLVLLLSLTGVVMGLLTSLVGLPQSVEASVWMGFYVAWGVVILKRRASPFTSALVASVLSGVWTGSLQIALGDAYIAHNPWYAEEIAKAGGMQPTAVMIFALGMGVAWGVLVGGILWVITRARARSERAS